MVKNNIYSDIYNLMLSLFILFIFTLIYFKYNDKCLNNTD